MPGPQDRRKLRRELGAARDAIAAAARKNGKKKPRQRVNNRTYSRPLRQGVGAITTKPFGSAGPLSLRCLDANHPSHLPLPRAIGAYTVVRTTQLITTTSKINLFGTFTETSDARRGKQWSSICCLRDVTASLAINSAAGSGNAQFLPFQTLNASNGWDNCSITPAAFTIQVMNPKALQGANGVARIARLRFMPDLRDDTRTWEAFGEECSSYNQPRLCAAAKLALRGVKVDAMPFDMSALSGFTALKSYPAAITGVYNEDFALEPSGFAPIMMLMDDAMVTAGGLDVLVTCEWRVRFDPSNPAQGTHQRYPVSSDSTWNSILSKMERGGHGVVDIAEDIAEAGAAVGTAAAVFG